MKLLGLNHSAIPRRTTTLVGILLLTTGTLISCSSSGTPGDRNRGHTFSTSIEDGVEVSVTSDVPKYTGQLFTFEEEVRLHQDEERPESLLNRAYNFTRGPDGRYYVPDTGDNRIVVFDGDGEYVFSFGREGEGPGEFRSLQGVEIVNDRIITFDTRLSRSAVFSTDGTLIGHYRLPGTGNMNRQHMVTGIRSLEDGRLVIRSQVTDFDDREFRPLHIVITVLSADGDTLGQVSGEPWSFGKQIFVDGYGGMTTNFYGPQSFVSFHPGIGIIKTHTIEPVLRWYDLQGNLLRIIRMEMEPEAVTEEERRGIDRYLQQQIDESDYEYWRAVQEEVRKQTLIPDVKSCWAGVSVDAFGYYWISRHIDYTSPDPFQEPTTRMLLSPAGEYLCDVRLPMSNSWLSQGHILTRQEDEETGEIILLVYRMIPIPEGFIYP